MFQTIDGVDVFVVDLPENPKSLLPIVNDGGPELWPYAVALANAIETEVVSEAGKYGINVTDSGKHWTIFRIIE